MTTTKPTDPLAAYWAIVDALSFLGSGEYGFAIDRLVDLAKDFGFTINGGIVSKARERLQ